MLDPIALQRIHYLDETNREIIFLLIIVIVTVIVITIPANLLLKLKI